MKKFAMAVLMAAACIGGCTSTDTPLKMSGTREEGTARCMKNVQSWELGWKTEASQFMGVSKDRLPAVFCQRVGAAIEQGRLTEADMIGLRRGHSTRIWKIIKGG